MTKTQRPKGSKKRKGGRQPVAFVVHPDTGLPVKDLRIHKSSGSYYRIADDKISRHRYHKNGRIGLAYLRRAIYEHECWQNGQAPTDSIQVVITEPAHDDFGAELPATATFDSDGNPVNVRYMGRTDLYAWAREQLSNPATRNEFADGTGYPELRNLHSLPAVVEPLALQEMIDRYATDKKFKRQSQTKDAKTIWAFFTDSVGVDLAEEITPALLQKYKRCVEESNALRTQLNHYTLVQGVLNHARKLFEVHTPTIERLKQRIRDNCQDWSQDKKTKAKIPSIKPIKPEQFRKLLAAAKKHSKFAYAMYMSAANFAFHPLEVAELEHDGLDLKDRILDSYREKDGIQHVAHVWTETIKAIKDFKASDEFGNHSKYMFVEPKDAKRKGSGEPWDTHRVDRLHRKLRTAAELPDSVKFDGIRKMTSTAMGAEHAIAQDWVMGHSGGMKDRYTTERIASETIKALTKARKAILGK